MTNIGWTSEREKNLVMSGKMLKKHASRLFSSNRSSSKLNRSRQQSQVSPLSTVESAPASPQLEDENITALPSLVRNDSEARSGRSEPLFRDSFLSQGKDAVPAEPSAHVAADWLSNMTGDLPPEDYDGTSDAPPPYESVVATTVTLMSPGKPRIIDLTAPPPPPIRAQGHRSPTTDPQRPIHSRSSSYFAESVLHSRPGSSYSDSSSDSVDPTPATPESIVSAPSISPTHQKKMRPMSRYNKFNPPRPSKPRSQTQPQYHSGTWFGTPPLDQDCDEAI